jgi:putative ABC transport system permease protein
MPSYAHPGQFHTRRVGSLVRISSIAKDLFNDSRYGFRFLLRNRSFGLAAILALSVGMGANLAILSIAYAVLIDPLPYPEADKLVRFIQNRPDRLPFVSGPNFDEWRSQQKSFVDLTVYDYGEYNLAGVERPLRARIYRVTPGFFDVLGVPVQRGRAIAQEDADRDVAVISARVSRMLVHGVDFGSSRITLDGKSHEIIGVMPDGFDFPYKADAWIPWDLAADPLMKFRKINLLAVLGRVMSGRTVASAQRDIDAISRGLAERFPEVEDSVNVTLLPLQEETVHGARTPLLVLLGAAALLLLVACVDVANLLIAKGLNRGREFAIRFSLGATRLRVIRQLLTEYLLLALVSAVPGFLLARESVLWLATRYPEAVPRLNEVQVDYRSVFLLLLLCIVSTALMGLHPAIRGSRIFAKSHEQLDNRAAFSTPPRRIQKLLLTGQIALTVCLAVAASILATTYWNLNREELGYDLKNVWTVQTVLTGSRYRTDSEKNVYFRRAVEGLQRIPGVISVGVANNSTFSPWTFTLSGFEVTGQEKRNESRVVWTAVGADYFRSLEIPVRAGRVFDIRDGPGSEPVIVLDQRAALQIFGRPHPIGESIKLWDKRRTIVGIVGDVKRNHPREAVSGTLYSPYEQHPTDRLTFLIKTRGKAVRLPQQVNECLALLDPDQPLYDLGALEQGLNRSISSQFLYAFLMAFFAGAALLLTVCGVYGTAVYQTSRRTSEIGIRMALGATRSRIFWMVFREGVGLSLLGVAVGTLGACALSDYLATMVYGIDPREPTVYFAVGLTVMSVALLACLFPTARIARLSPWNCLRYE